MVCEERPQTLTNLTNIYHINIDWYQKQSEISEYLHCTILYWAINLFKLENTKRYLTFIRRCVEALTEFMHSPIVSLDFLEGLMASMLHQSPQLQQGAAELGRPAIHLLTHPAGHTTTLLRKINGRGEYLQHFVCDCHLQGSVLAPWFVNRWLYARVWYLVLAINFGSGNGLVPSGTKPLPEPMLMTIPQSSIKTVVKALPTHLYHDRMGTAQSCWFMDKC